MSEQEREHGQGCRCFECDLEREKVGAPARKLATKYGVEVATLGAGGRALSPHVSAARRDFAIELIQGPRAWSESATARLLRVNPATVRYWLKGAP